MMRKTGLLLYGLVLICVVACMAVKAPQQNMETEAGNSTQLPGDTFLADLLGQFPEYFDSLLKNNDRYRIQII